MHLRLLLVPELDLLVVVEVIHEFSPSQELLVVYLIFRNCALVISFIFFNFQ